MRVIVTGSREVGSDPNIARAIISDRLFDLPPGSTIVHGGARGVDRIAGREAEKLGHYVEVHPADWDAYGKRAGFIRNKEMVGMGADLCLAFWNGKSMGTQHAIFAAKDAGIPVEVVEL
jgi:hypothetical protein